ncbi:Oidioi.mRNA.OKI2018_I69.PAR.g11393.t2.cds [Oikopleura dioica]|nr:Oidioi.mRNA.OKI2018_I69.PAR.g11393.t2.cds [Oikopleura dioica]
MPARSVLFDSIRKHDGKGMRDLIPSEYIQMAGRAGRRGLDTCGTVILVQRQQKCADQQELINMMLGKAAPLISKFRLTYGMLLSILRVGSLRVEDIMLRSFIEFGRRGQPTQIKELEAIKAKRDNFKDLEAKIDGTEFEDYVSTAKEMVKARCAVMTEVFNQGNIKAMSAGRLILVQERRIAVVLAKSSTTVTCLLNKKIPKSSIYRICNLVEFKFEKDDDFEADVVTIPLSDVSLIFKETINIRHEDILFDFKKLQIGSAANQASILLNKTASEKPLEPMNFIRDFGLNSVDQVEKVSMLESLGERLIQNSSPKLPYFAAELENVVELMEIRRKYKEPAELCAVLSSLVFQSQVDNETELIERLPKPAQEAIEKMKSTWEDVQAKETQFGILSTDHDSAAPLRFGLCMVVFNWASGESFRDIMRMTDIQEGVIVRCIQRLEELCREVRNGARTVGDFSTTSKLEQCSEAVKRDIVFAASLYTTGN